MKKKLLFAIAACALFLPATVFAAADPTYDEEVKAVFANGTPITVEERTDGEAVSLRVGSAGSHDVQERFLRISLSKKPCSVQHSFLVKMD